MKKLLILLGIFLSFPLSLAFYQPQAEASCYWHHGVRYCGHGHHRYHCYWRHGYRHCYWY